MVVVVELKPVPQKRLEQCRSYQEKLWRDWEMLFRRQQIQVAVEIFSFSVLHVMCICVLIRYVEVFSSTEEHLLEEISKSSDGMRGFSVVVGGRSENRGAVGGRAPGPRRPQQQMSGPDGYREREPREPAFHGRGGPSMDDSRMPPMDRHPADLHRQPDYQMGPGIRPPPPQEPDRRMLEAPSTVSSPGGHQHSAC